MSYATQQQQSIFQSDCGLWRKVDFIQPGTTSSVVGPRKRSKTLSKAKLAPTRDHGLSLVVCCSSDPLQFSESWQNHYIREVCSANWWDAPKTEMPEASTGQQKVPILLSDNTHHTSHNQCFRSWTNWAMKLYLICRIHLASRQPTTTSSSISTTFCRKNASTTGRTQKLLSKSSLSPEVWIFMLQE